MITSEITGKTYDPSDCIFLTNPLQCQKYLKYLGAEFLVDVLYTSHKREDALVFVWRKCSETAKAKSLWDQHQL